jgi:DNA-binding FadR family transcriptional regulator
MNKDATFTSASWTLARAHAQSGSAREVSEHLGNGEQFDEAITTFAWKYADQNSLDHQSLVDAVKSGRVDAATAEHQSLVDAVKSGRVDAATAEQM